MQSPVKPKPADDPHDLLEVAPGVALVAPSNAADPTDEELSNLLRAAARQRSGGESRKKPEVVAGPSAPPVDTTFRPAAVNHVRRKAGRWSIGRRTISGGVIGVVLALSLVVGAAAWQSYGDATTQMVAMWIPQRGPAPLASPKDAGLAEQPSPAGVQAAEITSAPEQATQSAPQAGVPAAAASPPAEAPTLQSMARDVATLEQKVEQLQATIEQLKAGQDQTSRDAGKSSDAKASDQNLRPKASPTASRPAVVPARKPVAAVRPPQASAPSVSSPLPAPYYYYGQRQPEPSPVDPEAASIPRPPLPLHQ